MYTINEKELINIIRRSILNESGMRGWKLFDEIKRVADSIIYKKDEILNSDEWFTFSLNLMKYWIKVGNYNVFSRDYPECKNAGGIMKDGKIIFYITPKTNANQIEETISHELEHVIDYQPENFAKINSKKEIDLQNLAYKGVYNPSNIENNYTLNQLDAMVRDILYRLLVTTEKNAFISYYVGNNMKIESVINSFKDKLKIIEKIPADKYRDFWYSISSIMHNRKNWVNMDRLTPEMIKKHFLRQSYHKLQQFANTLFKKKGYAQMNGIEYSNCDSYFLDMNNQIYGPYTFNVVKEWINKYGDRCKYVACKKKYDVGTWKPLFDFPEFKKFFLI